MRNYVDGLGHLFEGKYDCNNKAAMKGNFRVVYKGDCLTAHILWGVNTSGILVNPYHNNITAGKGFVPLGSDYIKAEETFDEDMTTFVKSNKPAYVIIDGSVLICDMSITFDEEGNITDDSIFQFYMPLPGEAKFVKRRKGDNGEKDDGFFELSIACEMAVTNKSNPSMFLCQISETILKGYENNIKKQLTKEICQDRKSFLSYLVKAQDGNQ